MGFALWICVFSANAINHLASVGHLKNLKGFLWKYGAGMDHLDSFCISKADLAKVLFLWHASFVFSGIMISLWLDVDPFIKYIAFNNYADGCLLNPFSVLLICIWLQWEKRCKSLKTEAAGEGSRGVTIGPSNDIHNELKSEYVDTFDKNNIQSLNSSFSNGVEPLQNYTNERYQVSHSEQSRVKEADPRLQAANSYLLAGTHFDTSSWGSSNLTGAYCHYLSFITMAEI